MGLCSATITVAFALGAQATAEEDTHHATSQFMGAVDTPT